MIDQKKLNDFMEQVKKIEKGHTLDLSSDEDLSIGIMNLISIEEHLFFTAKKTGKNSYFDLLAEVREIRKTLLKEIIKEYEGEVWCTSKHLLSASMRLMEVGTKALSTDKKRAYDFFDKAFNLYNLFWALNLKLIDQKKTQLSPTEKAALISDVEAETVSLQSSISSPVNDTETAATLSSTHSTWKKLGSVLNKILDCCRE